MSQLTEEISYLKKFGSLVSLVTTVIISVNNKISNL